MPPCNQRSARAAGFAVTAGLSQAYSDSLHPSSATWGNATLPDTEEYVRTHPAAAAAQNGHP